MVEVQTVSVTEGSSSCAQSLDNQINELLAQGWELRGPLVVTMSDNITQGWKRGPSMVKSTRIYQQMIRDRGDSTDG